MKLQILPAKQGLLWVRLGIRTFWRQPLAMTGQFFLFMGLLSLCSLIPFIGSFVGLALLPMAAGLYLGRFLGRYISEKAFRQVLFAYLLSMSALLVWR